MWFLSMYKFLKICKLSSAIFGTDLTINNSIIYADLIPVYVHKLCKFGISPHGGSDYQAPKGQKIL